MAEILSVVIFIVGRYSAPLIKVLCLLHASTMLKILTAQHYSPSPNQKLLRLKFLIRECSV